MTARLDLQPTRLICARHGEPFRDTWPTGYPTYATIIFDAINHLPEFAAVVGQCVTAGHAVGIPQAVGKLLDEAPACCRLPRETLLEVYEQVQKNAGPWWVAACSLCGRRGLGGPYRRVCPHPAAAGGQAPRTGSWPHVCLRCVCGL